MEFEPEEEECEARDMKNVSPKYLVCGLGFRLKSVDFWVQLI